MPQGWGGMETSGVKDLDDDRLQKSQWKVSGCKPLAHPVCGQEKGHFRITSTSGDGIKRDTLQAIWKKNFISFMKNSCHELSPGWGQSSGGFQPMARKKPPVPSISSDQGLGWGSKRTLLPCRLHAGTDSGNAFSLDIRFSCSADVSLNRKMDQHSRHSDQDQSSTPATVLDQQPGTQHSESPIRKSVLWKATQKFQNASYEPPNILDCFVRNPIFQNACVPDQSTT